VRYEDKDLFREPQNMKKGKKKSRKTIQSAAYETETPLSIVYWRAQVGGKNKGKKPVAKEAEIPYHMGIFHGRGTEKRDKRGP
jgi:hypothetical protein